ncbi:hypothetical protein [Paraburkholderia phenoliruptrix]|uniref:hypothetical protein n=1 Tax=Paraburkholderia phenoliruptrix TaxID=252970 RepID=UPI002869C8EF|nr:hypothetical protein [Paraburkholderia phenoliruptrix]WMY11048.1 hypothetical protein P3F88_30775 [Paraburkholderia phenoliruptrix]
MGLFKQPEFFSLGVQLTPGLFIRGMQFPNAVEILVGAGDVAIRSRNRLWRGSDNDSVLLACGETFDLLLLRPDALSIGALTIRLSAVGHTLSSYSALWNVCASEVLENPREHWNAILMARRLGLSSEKLRHKLFAEGAALSEIIWKQRCMSALVMLSTTDASLNLIAANAGFKDKKHMQTMVGNMLMVNLDRLERPAIGDGTGPIRPGRAELPSRVFRIRP